MGNVVWIMVLLLLGTTLVVLGLGHIAAGSLVLGFSQLAIAALNYFSAGLRMVT